eukprot:7137054-Alexandrium_andersonii.AAC.1
MHVDHVQLALSRLGSVGSIRYSVRSVPGVLVIEYLPGDAKGAPGRSGEHWNSRERSRELAE